MSMSSSSTRSLLESSFVFVELLNVGSILPKRGESPQRSCLIRSAENRPFVIQRRLYIAALHLALSLWARRSTTLIYHRGVLDPSTDIAPITTESKVNNWSANPSRHAMDPCLIFHGLP